MARKPVVFVSSTCYDLAQVREDLRVFIEDEIGFEALLSERPTFQVDPDATTLENCRRNVRETANMLVLIVGSRYGSVVVGGKSITNLEYEEAVVAGIPIFAFVEKSVLPILRLWQNKPDNDYSSAIPDQRLLPFVDSLYKSGDRWVFSFETAVDIQKVLREQWAFLFSEGLSFRRQLRRDDLSIAVASLSGAARRAALLRGNYWEFELLEALLNEEESRNFSIRRDYLTGLQSGERRTLLDMGEIGRFFHQQLSAAMSTHHDLEGLQGQIAEAIGTQGEDGNPEILIHVARTYGGIARSALQQAIAFRRINLSPEYMPVREKMERTWSLTIANVDGFHKATARWAHAVASDQGIVDAKDFEYELVDIEGKGILPALDELRKQRQRKPPPPG